MCCHLLQFSALIKYKLKKYKPFMPKWWDGQKFQTRLQNFIGHTLGCWMQHTCGRNLRYLFYQYRYDTDASLKSRYRYDTNTLQVWNFRYWNLFKNKFQINIFVIPSILIEEKGDTDRRDLETTIVSVRFFKEIRSSENWLGSFIIWCA